MGGLASVLDLWTRTRTELLGFGFEANGFRLNSSSSKFFSKVHFLVTHRVQENIAQFLQGRWLPSHLMQQTHMSTLLYNCNITARIATARVTADSRCNKRFIYRHAEHVWRNSSAFYCTWQRSSDLLQVWSTQQCSCR